MKTSIIKIIISSAAAVVLGTSCCWISALGVWVGGFTFVGVVIMIIKDFRLLATIGSVVLLIIAFLLYTRLTKDSIGSE